MKITSVLIMALFTVVANLSFAAPPYEPTFFDVRESRLRNNIEYYRPSGQGPQTVATYVKNGRLYTAGRFTTGVDSTWQLSVALRPDKFKKLLETPQTNVRQLSVITVGGTPRFTAISQKMAYPGYRRVFYGMNDQEFHQKYWELYHGLISRITEYSTYTVNGVRYHAMIFMDDSDAGARSELVRDMTKDAAVAFARQHEFGTGRIITSVAHIKGTDGVDYYSVILGSSMSFLNSYPYFGINGTELKRLIAYHQPTGHQIVKIIGHSDGLFSVVFAQNRTP